ncbi:hypothetical protein GGS26DRAFT_224949 [Hypomontagnella submonticulosa]|nr:hypothetical protein GGS26DRAFT_224949 [Hypomontagnella submonticulosa]
MKPPRYTSSTISTIISQKITIPNARPRKLTAAPLRQQLSAFYGVRHAPIDPLLGSQLVLSPQQVPLVAGMSNEQWHKSLYVAFLDHKLRDMEADQYLPYLKKEQRWLHQRYEHIVRRQGLDIACKGTLLTMKQFVTWRQEVVSVKLFEMQTYVDGLKAKKKKSSKSIWDRWKGAAKGTSIWKWLSLGDRER